MGLFASARGYIHALNHETYYIKSDFKDIFCDSMVLLTSKFHPQWVVRPCPGAIYMYKIMTLLYKIRLQRGFFFKLVANDRSNKRFLLTSTFCPLGLSALTCGCIHLLNHEKMHLKSEVEQIIFKLATNDHSDVDITILA